MWSHIAWRNLLRGILEWPSFPCYCRSNSPSFEDYNNLVRIRFDAFSFKGRMSVYKFLIEEIDPAILWNEPFREYHWLWAYGAQLDWQQRSGRLALRAVNGYDYSLTDRINPQSWWGYVNFCLSVAILLGLEKSQLLAQRFPGKQIVIEMDNISTNLLKNDPAVQAIIDIWGSFFREGYSYYGASILSDDPQRLTDPEWLQKRHALQSHCWKAHTETLYAAQSGTTYFDLLALMPMPEEAFGKGWAQLVDVLAAMNVPTDLKTLCCDGAGYLPKGLLTEQYWNDLSKHGPRSLSANEKRQVATVRLCQQIGFRQRIPRSILSFWRCIARHAQVYRTLPRTINELYHGTLWQKLRQSLRVLFLFPKQGDWIALAVFAVIIVIKDLV